MARPLLEMRSRTHPARRSKVVSARARGARDGSRAGPTLDHLALFESGTGAPHDFVALLVGLLLAARALATRVAGPSGRSR